MYTSQRIEVLNVYAAAYRSTKSIRGGVYMQTSINRDVYIQYLDRLRRIHIRPQYDAALRWRLARYLAIAHTYVCTMLACSMLCGMLYVVWHALCCVACSMGHGPCHVVWAMCHVPSQHHLFCESYYYSSHSTNHKILVFVVNVLQV
jgi:hypothetical protein